MVDALFDRQTGGPTSLSWCLVGVVLAIAGITVLVLHLTGLAQTTAGYRPRPGVSREVGTLIGLFLAAAGVATAWRGLALSFPRVVERRWVRRIAHLVIGTLTLASFAFGALMIAARFLR